MSRTILDLQRVARSSWPGCEWTQEFLERRSRKTSDPWGTHGADLIWAWACLLDEQSALSRLETVIQSMVPVVRSVRLDDDECDEALQGIRVRLLVATDRRETGLSRYNGTGPLGGFIRAVAIREALNSRRKRKKPDSPIGPVLDLVAKDEDLGYVRLECSQHFNDAVQSAWDSLDPQLRQLLRNKLCDGMTIMQLGRIYNIHPATVARRCSSGQVALVREVRNALRHQLDCGTATVSSVLRYLAKQDHLLRAF